MQKSWEYIYRYLRGIKRFAKRLLQLPLESLEDSPDLFRNYRVLVNDSRLQRAPGGWLYKEAFYPDYLTVGGASHAIFRKAALFCKGTGVDIGAGFWPLPGTIAIDIWRGPGVGKTIEDIKETSLDYIFSSHCLEHISLWKEALMVWLTRLKSGGIIFLYLPHPACAIWEPGSPFVGQGHCWAPSPEVIAKTLGDLHCEIIDRDDGPDAMFSFFVCAKKR